MQWPELYSKYGVTLDLYKDNIIVAILFSVSVLIMSSMEFAFFFAVSTL